MSKPVVQDLENVKTAWDGLVPQMQEMLDKVTVVKEALDAAEQLTDVTLQGDQDAVQEALSSNAQCGNLIDLIRSKAEGIDALALGNASVDQYVSEIIAACGDAKQKTLDVHDTLTV